MQQTNKNVLFVIIQGGQSTGKSTLINKIKQQHSDMNLIVQVARSVIKQQNITNQQLQNNINNCFQQLQYKILLAQCKRQKQEQEKQELGKQRAQKEQQKQQKDKSEEKSSNKQLIQFEQEGQNNILLSQKVILLDRCVISPLVYSLFYFKINAKIAEQIQNSIQFKSRIDKYKQNAIIFLLHPQKQIIKQDGVRKQSTFNELQEINSIYKEVLDKYQLQYFQIQSLENRIDFVNQKVKKLCC